MTCAEYLVKLLEKYNVSDAFGIPGGVIIPFLYALKDSSSIQPHLLYNEQSAAFAAIGYAQRRCALSCAYATRGPGIANMMTGIAEAYQESLPVLFITAHSRTNISNIRMAYDQEIDFVSSVSSFVKFAATINTFEDFSCNVEKALQIAVSERMGPVFLDFSSKLFSQEIIIQETAKLEKKGDYDDISTIASSIAKLLKNSKRPIFLIGDGIRKDKKRDTIKKYIAESRIPVLSSRGTQDIMTDCDNYFGYIGSHGIRYANFILSKADTIIALGNRMSFPIESKSFAPVLENKQIMRVDIDKNEFSRELPGVSNFYSDVGRVIDSLPELSIKKTDIKRWLDVCNRIKTSLKTYDLSEPCHFFIELLSVLKNREITYVCDVGNNEFFFSRAYEAVHPYGEILYSKSFGTLGCSFGKAIGAWYAKKRPIICIVGDQGFQYNIQELQYISHWNLPIKIILMNNRASGMIKEHEENMEMHPFHVSEESGYSVPDFRKVTEAYGIAFVSANKNMEFLENCLQDSSPYVIEYSYSADEKMIPNLPKGNKCYDLLPKLDSKLYVQLESL